MVLAATGCLALTPPAASAAARPFAQRFSTNDTGDITSVANTLLTCSIAEGQCAAALAGTATGSALNNNAYVMQYVNTDTALAPVPVFNSSTANLSLPAGATVLRAMLYFGGDSTAGAAGAPPPDAAARNTVLFKAPAHSYGIYTAAPLDVITTDGNDFQGVVDVTAAVSEAGNGTYSVANVQAGTGRDRQAGWSLVVAYRDTSQPPRNLTIFDGFQIVNSGNANVSIPVSGFQTPPTGPVRTRVGLVGYEGDSGSTGDVVKLNTTSLSDATNPANSVFNSSIAHDGVNFTAKNPNFVNQLGFDANLIQADGVLPNSATSAVIRLTTGGETYFPGVVTFATELFAPDVQLTKSVLDVNGGQVEPGDTLRYTVTATNTGGDDATNVVIEDPIPTHTTYSSPPGTLTVDGTPVDDDFPGTDRGGFDAVNNRVVFWVGAGAAGQNGGTLGPGASTTVTFDVTVAAPPETILSGTLITNAARADYFAQTLGVPLTADSNEVTTTVAAPDLTITKGPASFIAIGGATQDFALTVKNSGAAATDGTEVTVTDPIDASVFDQVAAGGTGWSCTPAAPTPTPTTVGCTRSDSLAAGASYPITVTAHVVGLPPVGDIANTASVMGGGDGDTTNNSSTAVGQATTRADLQILKSAEPTTALTGEQVTFTLRVRNGGPSPAVNAVVSDTDFAGNYVVQSATSTLGSCTTAVVCNLGTMAAAAEATVTIVATVTTTTPGPADNTASVASSTVDPDASNDTSLATVDVAPAADLGIAKTAAPDPLEANASATYTLTVHNAGPATAANVVVTDPLPQDLAFVSATAGCTHSAADHTVTCLLGSVASGANATVTIQGTVAASAAGPGISNSATVSSTTGDPNLLNNHTTHPSVLSLPVPPSSSPPSAPAADLVVSKRVLDGALVGRRLRYEIEVENHGPSTANAVTLTDALPGRLTFVSAAATQGSCSGTQTVTCALGDIAPGASATITLTVTPQRTGSVANTATATSATPDPDPGNNVAAATVGARFAPARVSVRKRADRASVASAGPVNYRIRVRNIGSAGARDLRVCDKLGAGLAFVSTRGARMRNGQACWTVKRLPHAKSRTFHVIARASSTTSARRVTNRVRVSGANVAARAAQARVRVLPAQSAGGGVTG